jgi:hydroxyacylglutathione hydrolase
MHIESLQVFSDNYIWLVVNDENKNVVAVDPGDAKTLANFLIKQNFKLTDILITHHHADHIGGVLDLLKHNSLNVYGPIDETIPGVTNLLQDNQELHLKSIDIIFKILLIPGHTLGHIAYYNSQHKILFCGDTLFSAGCGRIFEGTPQQMYESLQKINSLPDDTLIYCTHEYTLSNLKFALSVEPDNIHIKNKIDVVKDKLARKLPSLPSKLSDERKFNPFLRCDELIIRKSLENIFNEQLNDNLQTFTYLRKLKDVY